jgi:hypothetical protein
MHNHSLGIDSTFPWDRWTRTHSLTASAGPTGGEAGQEGGEVGSVPAGGDLDEGRVADVGAAIETLSKFCTPERLERLRSIANLRTRHAQFVFENPSNPNNVWACLRWVIHYGPARFISFIGARRLIAAPSHRVRTIRGKGP